VTGYRVQSTNAVEENNQEGTDKVTGYRVQSTNAVEENNQEEPDNLRPAVPLQLPVSET
jgi:hypothetical protein